MEDNQKKLKIEDDQKNFKMENEQKNFKIEEEKNQNGRQTKRFKMADDQQKSK